MDPRLLGSYLFAAAFDILMPVVLAVYVRHKLGVSWRYFWYGALVFFVFQIVTRIPAVQILQGMVIEPIRESDALQWAWLFALALSAGLFEEVGRYAGYRYLVFRRGRLGDERGEGVGDDVVAGTESGHPGGPAETPAPTRGEAAGHEAPPYETARAESAWRKGVMFGLGHGGLESVLLVGGSVILATINAMVILGMDPNSPGVPPEQLEAFRQARATLEGLPWWYPLLGAVERLFTVPVHVALSIVVLQVFVRGSIRWLFLAILAHFAINFVAVASTRWLDPAGTEVVIGLFGAGALYLIFRLRPRNEPV